MRRCWCGKMHLPWTWHDPTHGRIDRDIQELVEKNFPGIDRSKRVAIENTAQNRRDKGLSI